MNIKNIISSSNAILNTLLWGGLLGFMASCSDKDTIPNVEAAYCPDSISLQIPAEYAKLIYQDNNGADVLPMIVGESVQLGYTLSPDNITSKEVEWTTSDANVASVSGGKVTALSEKGLGYSVITVSPVGVFSGAKVSSTLKVQVAAHMQKATSITLSADNDEVYEGETLALSFDIEPESATYRTLTWTSSDESCATVDAKGVVKGVSTGGTAVSKQVTITATAMDGSGVKASKVITVKRIVDPTKVEIDQTYAADNGYTCAFNEGSLTLKYTTDPTDCTLSQIKWTSSDTNIATVSGGVVTYTGYGNVTITATCPNGASSSITLSIPKGLIRETYHNPNLYHFYDAQQSGNGTASSTEWHDGYITITTYTQTPGSKQRGDLKWHGTAMLHAGNYPFVALRMEEVLDKYKADGVTARSLKSDNKGTSESGTANLTDMNNGSQNGYVHSLKLSDGSYVYIYQLTKFPTTEGVNLQTFQFKVADIATIDHQITYNVYWLQTFKTYEDVQKYVTDVDNLTYEVKK